jgi:hypothetical protein
MFLFCRIARVTEKMVLPAILLDLWHLVNNVAKKLTNQSREMDALRSAFCRELSCTLLPLDPDDLSALIDWLASEVVLSSLDLHSAVKFFEPQQK